MLELLISICMRNKSDIKYLYIILIIVVTQQNLWTEIAYFYSKVK